MVLSNAIQHEIKKTLEFRSSQLENEFAEEFIVNDKRKSLRIGLLLFVILEYIAFGVTDWGNSPHGSQIFVFRTYSTIILAVVLLLRILILLGRMRISLTPNQLEYLDQALFVFFCSCLGILSAYARRHDASNYFICIIEGTIACPARFKKFLVSFSLALAGYILSVTTLSTPSATEILLLFVAGISVSVFQLLGIAHSELKTRESFLLQRQMEMDFVENMRLAGECLRQEQAKNRLVSVISHELRTPCQAISAMSSLLIESPSLNESDRESASIIQRGSDLLCGIVNDFLDMSRLDSDQITFKKEHVDLTEAAEDTFDMVSQLLNKDGRQVEAIYSIAPEVSPCVVTDSQRLKQMLLNLTANAVKFCNKGRIHVSFSISSPTYTPRDSLSIPASESPTLLSQNTNSSSTLCLLPHAVASAGEAYLQTGVPAFTVQTKNDLTRPMLCISVTDTGIGLAEDTLPRVFQEFFMVDDGPSRRFGGTGLGLAIVQRTAVGLGGTVQVSSRGIGTGTTFRIFIPYIPSPPPTLSLSFNSASPAHLSPCSIVLINCDDEARAVLCRTITESIHSANIADFGSLSAATTFLLECGSPLLAAQSDVTIFLIDCNVIGSSESLTPFLEQCRRSLQTQLQFILSSPLQDGFDDPAALRGQGLTAKIPKPIRRKVLIKEINRARRPPAQHIEVSPHSSFLFDRRKSIAPTDLWVGSHLHTDRVEQEILPPARPSISTPATSVFSSSLSGTPLASPDASRGSAAGEVHAETAPQLLIVDDNKIIQRALSRMLGSSFSCEIANDGQEAINMLSQNCYDCILMDFHMDVMDGIQATRLIRCRDDEKRNVPIIGLSADGLDSTATSAKEAGMNTFLVKPVQKKDLMAAIANVLNDKK